MINDNTPTTSPNTAVHALAYLPALVGALSQAPELDILNAAVSRFVAQRHTWYASTAIRPKGASGLAPPSFEVRTLLQALAWERLDQIDTGNFTLTDFNALLGEVLDSPAARALGMELHEALGWDDEIDAQQADPDLLKQLVWSALILEVDPPASRKPCHVMGYDLTHERNHSRPYEQIRAYLLDYLEFETRGVDGYRSRGMAYLALCILEPMLPELVRSDIPPDLLYGTLRWANFAHGVALAEMLQPGSSAQLTFQQLLDLPLEQSENADSEVLQIVAATRLLPALQWAIVHGAVAHRQNADYSRDDAQTAVSALDEYSARLSCSMLAVLRDPPHRIRMAEQKFREVMGDQGYLHRLIMRPSTTLKRMEFSFRNPSPYASSGEFYLIDVFAAGLMKNGTDQFEPHLQHDQQALLDSIAPALNQLKGIDMPALYEAAFNTWYEEAQAGYAVLIEHLLEQIPAEDRIRCTEGALTVYVLQGETAQAVKVESDQDRADHRGRFGFVIQCEHRDYRLSYEAFPFRAQLKRRTDLERLPTRPSLAQRPTGSRNIHRIGTPMNLDWTAYHQNRAPAKNVVSAVIATRIGWLGPAPATPATSVQKRSSERFAQIARTVARDNMFCDRQRTYVAQRGVTAVEYVGNNYPPVLRMAEILVPGLGCFNAVQTGELPVVTCAIDVGAIMGLPAFSLARGVFQIAVRSGQMGLLKALPAFGQAAGNFIRESGIAYRSALNPVGLGVSLGAAVREAGKLSRAMLKRMTGRLNRWAKLSSNPVRFRVPQRLNGRIGYPMSGRGAATSRVESVNLTNNRIRNVRDYDAFLETNDIFKGNARLRADMLGEIEAGADVRIHVRRDGSRTLIKKDTIEPVFVDLADNTSVRLESYYDYRALKSWAVENESTRKDLRRLALNRITSGREALDPQRLRSIKEAIEDGSYLPPLDVRRMGDGYEVINGNHRLRAAVEMQLENVPVIIRGPVTAAGGPVPGGGTVPGY